MSTRALAWTALLLAVLLAAASWTALGRLGHLEGYEAPGFVFENHTLGVDGLTRAIVRSMTRTDPQLRYSVIGRQVEIPDEPNPSNPVAGYAHLLLFAEEQRRGENKWYRKGPSTLAYRQLGARDHNEWLEELRLVKELRTGGGERLLLRATFGHESGARVLYFYDPKDTDPKGRIYGWIRREFRGGDAAPIVHFALPAGKLTPAGK